MLTRSLEKKAYLLFFTQPQQRKMPLKKLTLHLVFKAFLKKKMTSIKQKQLSIQYLSTGKIAFTQIHNFILNVEKLGQLTNSCQLNGHTNFRNKTTEN